MSRIIEIVDEIKKMPIEEIRKIRILIHNYEKDQKTVDKEPGHISSVVQWSIQSMEIAKELYGLSSTNFKMIKEPDLNAWAMDIEKLHNVDKQDFELIKAAMLWSQNNGFWKKNIRSGAALRKHFEKICIQAKGELEELKTRKGQVHDI